MLLKHLKNVAFLWDLSSPSDEYFVVIPFSREDTTLYPKEDFATTKTLWDTGKMKKQKQKRNFQMTKTGNKMRKILSFALVILTLTMLVFSLSACSSGESKYEKKGDDSTETLSDFVARIISDSKSNKIRFVAARNGYDMTAEDFVDSAEIKPANVAAAKAVMQGILDGKKKFANDTDKELFEGYMESLNETSIDDVINSKNFKKTYNTKAKTGFPSIILVGIGKFLGLITRGVGGYYIIAIMVFAIIVEIVMLPVAIKQQKNAVGMAKLRPAIAKIEKKYAGRYDQVTMRKKQEEIMALQQKEGYSPFSGCMPLLLQLIIVGFILYPIIQNPLRYVLGTSTGFSTALTEYATAPLAAGGLGLDVSSANVMELLAALNGKDLSGIASFAPIANGAEIFEVYEGLSMPKFTAFGINLGKLPSFTSILILVPILNVISQWASMFFTRRWSGTGYNAMGTQDSQDKFSIKMMDVLPILMTVFIMFQVPAMIGIYWFFRSLISLLKQYIMKHVMPVPKYTAEEIKEMEKAAKEREKAQKEALKQQPKFRSLHYIDEDDYDELPEAKPNTKSGSSKPLSGDAPEIKD